MSISVAIYVRLSNEDRNKQNKFDESESIQNQKSMLSEYCRERNWDIYDIYNDEDYSGTDKTRPEFNRMIADCENGRVNLVLCKSQSRFSRDAILIETYLHDKFLEWGVRFKSVVDNVDTDDKTNKKSRQISALVNEWYVEETSENVRKVLKHKREQGQFVGSFAPYGYMVDPKNKNHLVIDTAVADNVRLIFDMYTQGSGYRTIVKELNDRGIPSPSLYKQMCGSNFCNHNLKGSVNNGFWTQATIYTILRNETYTGTLVQGKSHYVSYKNHKAVKTPSEDWIRVYNTHDAIIDNDIWSKAQERINGRLRTDRVNNVLSPLSGKVKCAVCGAPMKRNVYYNKARTIQYYGLQCGTYKTGSMICANTKSISGLDIEKFLVQQINTHIRKYCNTHKLTLIDKHQEKINVLTETLKGLQAQTADKENKVTRVYEDYIDGVITIEQYHMISDKLTAEIEEYKSKSESILEQINNIERNKVQEANYKSIIDKYSYVSELTREVVEDFIERVYVGEVQTGKTREITIDWKF